MRSIAELLDAKIDEEQLAKDLLKNDSLHHMKDLAARIISGEDAQ